MTPKSICQIFKQIENGVIAIDLDFHYDIEIETRQHDKDDKGFVNAVIYKYVNKLKRYIDFEDGQSFRVYVMERPQCYMTDIKTKDGKELEVEVDAVTGKIIEVEDGGEKFIYSTSNGNEWVLQNVDKENDTFKKVIRKEDFESLIKDREVKIKII